MNIFSRRLLFSASMIVLLISSCNSPAQPTSIPSETSTITIAPTITLTDITPTALIPITGMDVVSLQCQFCVNDQAHAVLLMAEQVAFNVSDPATGVTCLTAQVLNGRRVIICRGAQNVSFNLNVCADSTNCLSFPIVLQTCPLISQTGTVVVTITPLTPFLLTPIPVSSTPRPPRPTQTGIVPPPATTAPPPVTTEPPPATTEPPPPPASSTPEPPTAEPATNPPTSAPTST
jgi:hypothetical protein